MAWLSGLADKAENLLNKIDKNTAAVLNKDKYELSQPQLTEVTWNPPEPRHANTSVTNSPIASSRHFPHIRSTPNLASLATNTTAPCKDDELLTFLNTPDASPRKLATDSLISPPTPSSLIVEHPTDTTDSISDMSLHSNCSSPHFMSTVMEGESEELHLDPNVTSDTIINSDAQLPSSIMVDNQQIGIIETDRDIEQDFDPTSNKHPQKYSMEVQRNGEKTESFGKLEIDYQKEIIVINEKLENVEMEKQELAKQLVELQTALERSRLELNSTRSDLEQHKARAFKTLQEKEKLIAELRRNEITGMDEATAMELNQLRQERDTLREENLHISEQLRIVREELMNADIKLEKIRQKTNEANTQAQEMLTTERHRRLEAEEDARTHSEEARSLKDEVLRIRTSYTTQLQKQDSEIARLRTQLSASSTPSSAVETRLTTLTQTLVMKQQALENLTTERNALRLQLEKIEHEFRNTRRNVSYSNVNDTDDAKAQVPTFLLETPFDTGVTRRVKRAYSSLDAISIRTGVFLRRYPLARILVLIYMAMLQFWVLIVLFSQSPEAH